MRTQGPVAEAAVAPLNARTGHGRVPYDFLAYGGSRSRADFPSNSPARSDRLRHRL
ncbi:hypothetical protein [Kitasatospora sp. NPDC088783]|uniref:hypothetical protein n=1 Tax=Kitasatospora sp. NPDC088783 TaxID=3364077 RepID=UPI00381F7B10